MPGDAFASILSKKEQLKQATEDTDIGVRGPRKAAVGAKRGIVEPEATEPAPKDDKRPTKYNMPRNKGESMGDYADRLEAAQKAERAERK